MLKRQKSAGELKVRETKIVRTPSRVSLNTDQYLCADSNQ
jgi:hypothetical protein